MLQERINKRPSNKDNVDGTERVEYGYIGYHVVHMYPKNCNVDEYCLSKFNIYVINEWEIVHSKCVYLKKEYFYY